MILNLIGQAVQIGGLYLGKKFGEYVAPSIVAPVVRNTVTYMSSPTTIIGKVATHIAAEEAGYAAFSATKVAAPLLFAPIGGIAGEIAFQSLTLAAGYAGTKLYTKFHEAPETPAKVSNKLSPK